MPRPGWTSNNNLCISAYKQVTSQNLLSTFSIITATTYTLAMDSPYSFHLDDSPFAGELEAQQGTTLTDPLLGAYSSSRPPQSNIRKRRGCGFCRAYGLDSTSLPPVRHRDQGTSNCVRLVHLTVIFIIAIVLVGFLGHKHFEDYMVRSLSVRFRMTTETYEKLRRLHYGHWEKSDSGPMTQDTQRETCMRQAEWTRVETHTKHPGVSRLFGRVAKTYLDLPRNSTLLYFLSSGALSRGSLHITDDGDGERDIVQVEIKLTYDTEDTLSSLVVCTLQRGEDENGIGIFVRFYHLNGGGLTDDLQDPVQHPLSQGPL